MDGTNMHVDSWMKPVQGPEEPADSTLRGSSLPEEIQIFQLWGNSTLNHVTVIYSTYEAF